MQNDLRVQNDANEKRMELQKDPATGEYAYLSTEYDDDDQRVWATPWCMTEAEAREEAKALLEHDSLYR